MSEDEQKAGRVPLILPPKLSCRQRRTAVTVPAVCVLAAVFAGAVHAADDAGIYDFIRSQAPQSRSDAAPSSPLRHAQPIVPKVAPQAARHVREPAFREPAPREHKAVARQLAREPRARFASLPRVEERAAVRSAKPPVAAATPPKSQSAPATAGSDPIASLLRDPTLRPGDIVMFPDGARVFKGGRALPHAANSFEEVERSRLVSKASRKMVLALTKTVASPGEEASRYLPNALAAAPSEAEQKARSEVVRVIYPAATR